MRLMKKILLLFLCTSFSSCLLSPLLFLGTGEGDDESYEYVSSYEAVSIKRADLDASIAFKSNVEIIESSKIYIFDEYIFITDTRKGFHIFDNSDPSNPIKKTFLSVPGATDIAIRNDVFFINQATDLVSLTINPDTFTFEINKRLENVFPELSSPDGFRNYDNEEDSVTVNWILK